MDYYDQISKSYDELYGKEQQNKLSIIKENIKITKKTKILDIGCGNGISSNFDCFVVGVDPSIELLKQNKREKLLAVAEDLPFKDNSFDCVVSITAIHNFKNIKKSINEMKRVGKGCFVFRVLKRSGKFDFIQKLIQKNFKVGQMVGEEKDAIFFCEKRKLYTKKISEITDFLA